MMASALADAEATGGAAFAAASPQEKKAAAAATYAGLNASAQTEILPFIADDAARAVVAASVEAGAWASAIVASGWTVMLLGYAGERTGQPPNATRLSAAIASYDEGFRGYRALADKFGPAAPGLYNDSFWQHPQSGVPGMRQSVDRFRDAARL